MPSFIDALTDALKTEFKNKVQFSAALPSQVSAPAVIVAPGDPFIEPGTMTLMNENWDVLVAVSLKDAQGGIAQMRNLSLRVRKAAISVGAHWIQASGPRTLPNNQNTSQVVSINSIRLAYEPGTYTESEA